MFDGSKTFLSYQRHSHSEERIKISEGRLSFLSTTPITQRVVKQHIDCIFQQFANYMLSTAKQCNNRFPTFYTTIYNTNLQGLRFITIKTAVHVQNNKYTIM